MALKIAINGFGRIGRVLFRILQASPDFEVIAINDIAPQEKLIYLTKHDTIYGALQDEVDFSKIRITACKDLASLDWEGVDVVIEATGKHLTVEENYNHLKAKAKRVIITAPAKSKEIKTVCYGINQETITKDDLIISNASCTTNCLAPVAKAVHRAFGIEQGLMSTVHAVTASQPGHDLAISKGDDVDSRAAFANIIPSSTGAAKALGLVLPELEGKLTGMAFRVPVLTGSVIDLTLQLTKGASIEALKKVFQEESEGSLKGILGISMERLVSSDIIGSSFSAIVDIDSCIVANPHFVKVVAWYDNEWGYSSRVADLCRYLQKFITTDRPSAIHKGTYS